MPLLTDFDNPTGAQLGLINVMQLIGGIAALPIAPWLSDAIGRRHPIAIGSFIIILGAAVQGAANGLGMFMAGRALVGAGGGLIATAAAPLIAELAYPTQRPVITSIFNTSWYLGSIVAAWVTYGTFRIPNSWSWRIPSLLQALPSILQLAFVYAIPESPRWLISKERSEEAEKILTRYHCADDTPSPLVRWELAEITVAIRNEESQDTASYMHFLKTPGNRHRLFIAVILGFMIQWCGNGLISVYLVQVLRNIGITDPETQNLINGILQIVNYLTALGAAFYVDRFGRRFMFLLSLAGMTVAFVVWTAVSAKNEQQDLENRGLGIAIVVMIFVFFVFYNVAMNPIPVAYLLEIMPYTLRAKSMTVMNTAQFCSIVFNGFANPIALEAIGWRYYIVYAVVLPVWFVVVWFTFPETKGLSLEEVAVVFDGEDAARADHVRSKAGVEEV